MKNTLADAKENIKPISTSANNPGPRPWIDPDGKLYSDDVLRIVSRLWDADLWELFLAETVDGNRQEVHTELLANEDVGEPATSVFEQFASQSGGTEAHELKQLVRYENSLTHQQRQIIDGLFRENKSGRSVARSLGVSENLVRIQKARSLKKLRRLLENHMRNFHYR